MREDNLFLCNFTEDLRNDKEIVLEAVRQTGQSLKYASEELKNDRDI